MKKTSRIELDPAKVREFCLNQPVVTMEEAVNSILVQNGKPKKYTFLNAVANGGCQGNVSYTQK